MQNTIELTDWVRDQMITVFGVESAELPDDAAQKNCPRWTSLNHITLLASIEEQLDLSFSMNEIMEMTNLPSIVAVLKHYDAVI